jgi:hypothetical protein
MKEAEAYRDDGSPYAAAMKRLEASETLLAATAVGPEHISRAILRAIRARRPRARYVAPFTGHLMLMLLAILPTSITDAAFRRVLGLPRRRVSAPAPAQIAAGA